MNCTGNNIGDFLLLADEQHDQIKSGNFTRMGEPLRQRHDLKIQIPDALTHNGSSEYS